jgi:hypothetical protein
VNWFLPGKQEKLKILYPKCPIEPENRNRYGEADIAFIKYLLAKLD